MKTLKRRRQEKKTDYVARLALLKSNKPRLVIRKTNKYILVQLVKSEGAQDFVVATLSSRDLPNVPDSDKGSLKSLSAAYATGFLLASKVKGNFKEAILDIGMNRNIHKSRIYSALKGAIDAGLLVNHSKEALPSDDSIEKNKKLAKVIEKLSKEKKNG